jgi:uncharacterized protein (TIGR03437 family)
MRFALPTLRQASLLVVLAFGVLAQTSGPYALTFGSAGDESVADFCVDSGGSYITAFTFQNALNFTGGTNPDQQIFTNGMRDNGLIRYDFLGNVQWAMSWGNASDVDRPVAVACDRNGFIYVAGVFEGTMDADPRFGTQLVTSNGSTDAYLIKLTNSGNFVWARTFGGTQADAPLAVSVDANGGIVLVLSFQGSMDADPSPGKMRLLASQGGSDVATLRLTPSGNLEWANSARSAQNVGASGAAAVVDSLGQVIVVGSFQGSVNVSPTQAPAVFTSEGENDLFLVTYSRDGVMVTARAIQGPGNIRLSPSSLALDSQDNLFLMGMFKLSIDTDTSFGTRILTAQQNSDDIFVASYDRNNVLRWSWRIGGLLDEQANSMRLDRNGTLILGGSFRGSFNLNPGFGQAFTLLGLGGSGATDGFIAKYRADSGAFVSGFALSGLISGPQNQNAVKAAQIDTMGNVVIAGNLFGAGLDFNPNGDPVTRNSSGGSDLFVAAYSWRNSLRTPTLELEAPILRANTNAASFLPAPVVPGSLATIFGLNISTKNPAVIKPDVARSFPIPTKLCNTEIVFEQPGTGDSWKAPIVFCSDFQINYQVPRDLPMGSYVVMKVIADNIVGNDMEVRVGTDDIGLFMENPAQKVAAMTFAFGIRRGQKVLPTNSVTACDIMEVFVTGLGQVIPELPPDGTPPGNARRALGDAEIVVFDDGTQGRLPGFEVAPRFVRFDNRTNGLIKYTGVAPSFAGLYQINVEWPNPQDSTTSPTLRLNQGNYPAFIEFRGRRSQEFIFTVRYSAENPSPCRILF